MEETRKNNLILDYKNGMSNKDIKKKYKISTDTFYTWIKNEDKKQFKNLNKFKDLTNKELQYWLGFICADGGVVYNEKNKIFGITLTSKDEEVVRNFKYFFGDIVKIYYTEHTKIWNAKIYSKKLALYFINNLNIVPKKALILNPNIEFTSNFLLGFFDGDGCIVNSTIKRVRYESKFTSGSLLFIKKIKLILDSKGIFSKISQKENAFDLSINRKLDSEKLYHFLYQNYTYCLSRKLNNFVALFGNIEKKELGELLEFNGESAAKLSE